MRDIFGKLEAGLERGRKLLSNGTGEALFEGAVRWMRDNWDRSPRAKLIQDAVTKFGIRAEEAEAVYDAAAEGQNEREFGNAEAFEPSEVEFYVPGLGRKRAVVKTQAQMDKILEKYPDATDFAFRKLENASKKFREDGSCIGHSWQPIDEKKYPGTKKGAMKCRDCGEILEPKENAVDLCERCSQPFSDGRGPLCPVCRAAKEDEALNAAKPDLWISARGSKVGSREEAQALADRTGGSVQLNAWSEKEQGYRPWRDGAEGTPLEVVWPSKSNSDPDMPRFCNICDKRSKSLEHTPDGDICGACKKELDKEMAEYDRGAKKNTCPNASGRELADIERKMSAIVDRQRALTAKFHKIEEESGHYATLRDKPDLWTPEYRALTREDAELKAQYDALHRQMQNSGTGMQNATDSEMGEAVLHILKAFPGKDRAWAEQQLARAASNVEGPVTAAVLKGLLQAEFGVRWNAGSWSGSKPTSCQLCGGKFGEAFYDAPSAGGQWGLLCEACWRQGGGRLGTGMGQKYDIKTLEKLNAGYNWEEAGNAEWQWEFRGKTGKVTAYDVVEAREAANAAIKKEFPGESNIADSKVRRLKGIKENAVDPADDCRSCGHARDKHVSKACSDCDTGPLYRHAFTEKGEEPAPLGDIDNSTDQARDLQLIKESEAAISRMRAWLAAHDEETATQEHAKTVSQLEIEETVLAGLRKGLKNARPLSGTCICGHEQANHENNGDAAYGPETNCLHGGCRCGHFKDENDGPRQIGGVGLNRKETAEEALPRLTRDTQKAWDGFDAEDRRMSLQRAGIPVRSETDFVSMSFAELPQATRNLLIKASDDGFRQELRDSHDTLGKSGVGPKENSWDFPPKCPDGHGPMWMLEKTEAGTRWECPTCKTRILENALCPKCGEEHRPDQHCYPHDVLPNAGLARGAAKYGNVKGDPRVESHDSVVVEQIWADMPAKARDYWHEQHGGPESPESIAAMKRQFPSRFK